MGLEKQKITGDFMNIHTLKAVPFEALATAASLVAVSTTANTVRLVSQLAYKVLGDVLGNLQFYEGLSKLPESITTSIGNANDFLKEQDIFVPSKHSYTQTAKNIALSAVVTAVAFVAARKIAYNSQVVNTALNYVREARFFVLTHV